MGLFIIENKFIQERSFIQSIFFFQMYWDDANTKSMNE